MPDELSLLIGTYTQPILQGTGKIVAGRGAGIYAVRLDTSSGRFTACDVVARTPNPSFLCLSGDEQVLYAVNELKEFDGVAQGSVSAFRLGGSAAEPLCVRPTGGTDPCHVALSRDGRLLVVSNFMSGSICAYAIGADGGFGEKAQFFQHEGHGRDQMRQSGPHAHSATFDFTGRFVYVPDLGLDEIKIYSYGPEDGSLLPGGSLSVTPGSGPRYCEFNKSNGLLYAINEINCTVDVFRADPATGGLTLLSGKPTLPPAGRQRSTGAALRVAPDGRHVFGSNRGDDSITVFETSSDGSLADPRVFTSGGATPRDFTIDPSGRFLIVVNQDSDNLVCFSITEDGGIGQRDEITIPTPVCVICASWGG